MSTIVSCVSQFAFCTATKATKAVQVAEITATKAVQVAEIALA
ncbi:hypothetical protein LTSEJOH_2561 [Salmonella enterica subsp. enterica serovar Johannesburg str. S5-703]|nr:hypothetical protein LTSEJOH_2561 [Salmonella enterica subsp. enterica serovar Johannesburg str. S5-703]